MNPNTLVETIRIEVANYRAAMTNSDHLIAADEIVNAVEQLDGALRHGGSIPETWTQTSDQGQPTRTLT
jgi:hypothetical protein